MPYLVADVGGTNTRLAVFASGHGLRDIARYENDRFGSFLNLLADYCKTADLTGLTACCIAVAGPVTSSAARLTNRDWIFDLEKIAAALPSGPQTPVRLINDLAALGHALPTLGAAQVDTIRAPDSGHPANDQALVVGVGTGFNVCMVRMEKASATVLEAELGHASLPSRVFNRLQSAIGAKAAGFVRIEDLFSGRGIAQLHQIISDGQLLDGPEILAAYDPAAHDCITDTVELAAELLGLLARDLVFQYQPFRGLHFAGGAARGLLGSSAKAVFLQSLTAPGQFADHIRQVPVRVITDDAAALVGAARCASDLPAQSIC